MTNKPLGGSPHHAEDICSTHMETWGTCDFKHEDEEREFPTHLYLGCSECLVPWPCDPYREARRAEDAEAAAQGRPSRTTVHPKQRREAA